MASRLWKEVETLDHGVKVIAGSFAPAGTGAPTTVRGSGFTVARTDVGIFTVTLTDAYVSCLSATATLQLATAADQYANVGDIDVASAKTVVIETWDVSDAALADITANANNRVNFVLVLKNSSV